MASLVCIVGNHAVWHGRVDALIGSVALTSLSDSDDEDDDDDKDDGHFVEVKKNCGDRHPTSASYFPSHSVFFLAEPTGFTTEENFDSNNWSI